MKFLYIGGSDVFSTHEWVKAHHYSGIDDKEHNVNKKASSRISLPIRVIL
jgi:hypothetical protein